MRRWSVTLLHRHDKFGDQFNGVQRKRVGAIANLMAATCAWRNNNSVRRFTD
jgi:hypothetical protein